MKERPPPRAMLAHVLGGRCNGAGNSGTTAKGVRRQLREAVMAAKIAVMMKSKVGGWVVGDGRVEVMQQLQMATDALKDEETQDAEKRAAARGGASADRKVGGG